MLTTIALIIGILFILNGITSMSNSRTVEQVRSQIPPGCEIFFGGSKGLLLLSSTDALIGVRANGTIAKAFCVRSGWLRRSKATDLHLDGYKMEKIQKHLENAGAAEQKACFMALRQYSRRRK